MISSKTTSKTERRGEWELVYIHELKTPTKLIDYINGKFCFVVENPFNKSLFSLTKAKKAFEDDLYAKASGSSVVMPNVYYIKNDKLCSKYQLIHTNSDHSKRFFIRRQNSDLNVETSATEATIVNDKLYINCSKSTSLKEKVSDEDNILNTLIFQINEVVCILLICFIFNVDLSNEKYNDVENETLYKNILNDINENIKITNYEKIELTETNGFEHFNDEIVYVEETNDDDNKTIVASYINEENEMVPIDTILTIVKNWYNNNKLVKNGSKFVPNREFIDGKFITNLRKRMLFKALPKIKLSYGARIRPYTPKIDENDMEPPMLKSFQINAIMNIMGKRPFKVNDELRAKMCSHISRPNMIVSYENYNNIQNDFMNINLTGLISFKINVKFSMFQFTYISTQLVVGYINCDKVVREELYDNMIDEMAEDINDANVLLDEL